MDGHLKNFKITKFTLKIPKNIPRLETLHQSVANIRKKE